MLINKHQMTNIVREILHFNNSWKFENYAKDLKEILQVVIKLPAPIVIHLWLTVLEVYVYIVKAQLSKIERLVRRIQSSKYADCSSLWTARHSKELTQDMPNSALGNLGNSHSLWYISGT